MPWIKCCASCAHKMEERYIMIDLERTGTGKCPYCFQDTPLILYEISQRKQRYRRQSGGGEREKAGGGR